MGKAYQCDRCYSFDTDVPVLAVQIKSLIPPIKTTDREFCPACLAEFHDWLDAYAENTTEGDSHDG